MILSSFFSNIRTRFSRDDRAALIKKINIWICFRVIHVLILPDAIEIVDGHEEHWVLELIGY
jgi:hypothetical protein